MEPLLLRTEDASVSKRGNIVGNFFFLKWIDNLPDSAAVVLKHCPVGELGEISSFTAVRQLEDKLDTRNQRPFLTPSYRHQRLTDQVPKKSRREWRRFEP